ncbi:MAG: RNA-binding S4 domain-containing protein [Burkholderiales bacterium]|jgi:ribosome-associated heat shock protein Hsp15|nr:RNA-binding S4 domain-containing protein [Burkholderiales bacterium]
MDKLRIDKWLWAARFHKTRSLATDELNKGRVLVNGLVAKPSREVKPGDTVTVRNGPVVRTVTVCALSDVRGPAPVAQALYTETADSLRDRVAAAELRRLAPEPAWAQAQGRPTKRDRRQLQDLQFGDPAAETPHTPIDWDNRWRATLPD